MGKPTGFLEYPREEMQKEAVPERVRHFHEFEEPLPTTRVRTQAARCMDCGIPFCNWGCPVENLIPEFNHLVFENQWESAYKCLQSTNSFPEFTGRICPAPCEPACTAAIVETPITIKQIERAIIDKAFEKGWVQPYIVKKRSKFQVAIVGSGPAGLAAANYLNRAGHTVVVFEKNEDFGGLLRYGIPNFKLEKWLIDRRISLLKEEGIVFRANQNIGTNLAFADLLKDFDLVGLCCGAEEQRPLGIPGAQQQGVHLAMDFLTLQNKALDAHSTPKPDSTVIHAKDRHVVILGGGDTGSDCIGTAIRHGAKSVTQIQIHKRPPDNRMQTNPWPESLRTYQTSSSQQEGCERIFSHVTNKVLGDGQVNGLEIEEIQWPEGEIKSGMRNYQRSGHTRTIPCDLLLVSLGFSHTRHEGLVNEAKLDLNPRGNVQVKNFKTNENTVYAAGDMVEGANLVVTAINSGQKMAVEMIRHFHSLE